MGQTSMDVAGVRRVAAEFDATAAKLQQTLDQLNGLSFSGASAGHMLSAKGDAIHGGLRGLVDDISTFKRATSEIAEQLRASAQRYVDADNRHAQDIGAVDG